MDEYTQEVQKKIDSLPESVRQFVYSAEMSKALQDIGSHHQLHIDQIGALEAETAALIIGVTDTEEFVSNLRDALEIDATKSEAVAKEVNEKILLKIREGMKGDASAPVPREAPKTPLATQLPVFAPASTPAPVPKPMPASTPTTVVPAPLAPAIPPVAPAVAPKPAQTPDMMAADAMLSEKKVALAPITPTTPATAAPPATPGASKASPPPVKPTDVQPQNYKADPYREPIE